MIYENWGAVKGLITPILTFGRRLRKDAGVGAGVVVYSVEWCPPADARGRRAAVPRARSERNAIGGGVMAKKTVLIAGLLAGLLAGPAAGDGGETLNTGKITIAKETNEELARQVREAETAFAKTMADRDLRSFESYISEEALFFGGKGLLRGKGEVVRGWSRFFEGLEAPFSWEPEQVAVLDSGTLALSTGPVRDPKGKRIGTFNSIWRREADGRWKIIFDKGCPPCDCPPAPNKERGRIFPPRTQANDPVSTVGPGRVHWAILTVTRQ
jgi:ketosteroid isomerase-like protein